jgi:phosphoribosyl-ATP pyrophosphohydrolase
MDTVIIEELWEVICERAENPSTDSYVSSVLNHRKGIDKSLEKLGEEATEYIIAVKNGDKEDTIYEAADLFFHFLISLKAAGLTPEKIFQELVSRKK